MKSFSIYLAPIQGVTDYTFRNLVAKHFSGIERSYTPFIRFQNELEIKKSQLTDLLPENNIPDKVIPQVLSNKAEELIFFAKHVETLGYKEFNWNLGCPYPMVAKRQMGSGLLPFPERIAGILDKVFPVISAGVSIKMRLGYADSGEVIPVLKILDNYPFTELIIHPRIGTQMYKGHADIDMFGKCLSQSRHRICYNGDISGTGKFAELQARFPTVNRWMIGRSLISDLMLAEEIRMEKKFDHSIKLERFSGFHLDLFESYSKILSGPGHLLLKMEQMWEYFSKSFDNPHKVNKLIKKSNSIAKYKAAVQEIFNRYNYVS